MCYRKWGATVAVISLEVMIVHGCSTSPNCNRKLFPMPRASCVRIYEVNACYWSCCFSHDIGHHVSTIFPVSINQNFFQVLKIFFSSEAD